MKKIIAWTGCLLFAMGCFSQEKKQVDSTDKEERRQNIYANRKYSFSVSWNPYGNISNHHTIDFYKSVDICFSDRMNWLDVGKNASLETTLGIGFEPYQGTKLHLGMDYELLSKKYKINLYAGAQYSIGLAQPTALNDSSSISLGFHHYLMPFMGIMWWPGKEDNTSPDSLKKYLYQSPGFWQLFYVKFQVGYSFLLNKLQVDSTGLVGGHLFDIIRGNTANTLNFKVAVGINIPSSGRRRLKYRQLLGSKEIKLY